MADQTAKQSSKPVAIVTGAGSGIGEATARLLTEKGYRVALVGRTAEKLERVRGDLGDDAVSMPADVGNSIESRRVVREAIERLGRVDAIVNNAGAAPLTLAADYDDDLIHHVFGVNTLGPIALAAEAIPAMLESGGGVIVNVSSMSSRDPFPGLGVYGAAKAAMNAFSVGIVNEYGSRGIRSYAVAPGAVHTPMLRSIFPEDQLPRDQTLEPMAVAKIIVACVTAETEEPNGATIWVPSP